MKKDYFAILGIRPSASDKEIRSAYKKLAKKYHPDLNPNNKQAEEKFKEINEAYEVLTDPAKRRAWETGDADFDLFAHGAGSRNPEFRRGVDMGDFSSILNDLFGGTRGRGTRGGDRARFVQRGADLEYEAAIGFADALLGTTLRIPLARAGAGGTIQVRIPPGVEDGGRVKVAGKGEEGINGGPAGDLYVVLRVPEHRYFRREGGDVILELPLTVGEAALGTRVEVPTLEGRVTLTVPAGSRSGQRLRLKGKGAGARPGQTRGDQIVVLQIVPPARIDQKSRKILEEFEQLNPVNPRLDLGW